MAEKLERWRTLKQLEQWLDPAMLFLSLVWLVIVVVELIYGLGPLLSFEPAERVEGGFVSYWDALWWTGMLLTTLGSQFWPLTTEGRVLAFLLSLYALGVLGYLTATFASFFIGRDAAESSGELVGSADLKALRTEVEALRRALEESRVKPSA